MEPSRDPEVSNPTRALIYISVMMSLIVILFIAGLLGTGIGDFILFIGFFATLYLISFPTKTK